MKYKCFECEITECIQHHHVVPRSVGGTKTIPLCSICHGKVHGIKRDKQINASELTKLGMARAKANGVSFGNPNWKTEQKKGRVSIQKNADAFALKMLSIIQPMLLNGMGHTAIANSLNNSEVKTRRGGCWTNTTVRRLVKRINNLEDK